MRGPEGPAARQSGNPLHAREVNFVLDNPVLEPARARPVEQAAGRRRARREPVGLDRESGGRTLAAPCGLGPGIAVHPAAEPPLALALGLTPNICSPTMRTDVREAPRPGLCPGARGGPRGPRIERRGAEAHLRRAPGRHPVVGRREDILGRPAAGDLGDPAAEPPHLGDDRPGRSRAKRRRAASSSHENRPRASVRCGLCWSRICF